MQYKHHSLGIFWTSELNELHEISGSTTTIGDKSSMEENLVDGTFSTNSNSRY